MSTVATADVDAAEQVLELCTYEPIEEVKNIIGTLVENIYNNDVYQGHLRELEGSEDATSKKKAVSIKRAFSNIRVFNTNKDPLFLAKDIGILLGLSNINTKIAGYTEGPRGERIVGQLLINGKLRKYHFLTVHGVYRILLSNRTKLSALFRGFIYKLIDHMQMFEVDKLKSILHQYANENPELVRHSIVELHENYNKYREMYEHERREREFWEIRAEEEHARLRVAEEEYSSAEVKLTYSELYIRQLSEDREKMIDKLCRFRDDHLPDAHDYKETNDILMRKFMKEINIFVLTPEQFAHTIVTSEKKIRPKAPAAKRAAAAAAAASTEVDDMVEELTGAGQKSSPARKKPAPAFSAADCAKIKATAKKYSERLDAYGRLYSLVVRGGLPDEVMLGDETLCYYVAFRGEKNSDEKYTHVATEWIFDKARYDMMVEHLDTECDWLPFPTTKRDHVHITTLYHIKGLARAMLRDDA